MEHLKNYSFATSNFPACITNFADWCRDAEIDEWTALLRLTGGDHAAMTMLRFALRWGEAEHVKEAGGWFYRTQEQLEADAALTRDLFERARKTLRSRLGMMERRQRVRLPGGDLLLKNVIHYRIDPVVLRAAFDLYCLEEAARTVCKTHRELLKIIASQTAIYSGSQVGKNNTSQLRENNNSETRETDTSQTGDVGDSQTRQNTQYQDSYKESHQGSLQGSNHLSSQSGDERDVHPEKHELPDCFGYLFDRLGTPNGKTASIIEQYQRLGDGLGGRVIARCNDRAKTWDYVLEALRRETEKPEVQVEIAGRVREEERWRQYEADLAAGLLNNEPVLGDVAPTPLPAGDDQPATAWKVLADDDPHRLAWDAAYMQMDLQFGTTRFDVVRGARLLGFEDGCFIVGVRTDAIREILQNRLYRSVARILSDAWGQSATIRFEVVR